MILKTIDQVKPIKHPINENKHKNWLDITKPSICLYTSIEIEEYLSIGTKSPYKKKYLPSSHVLHQI